MPHFGHAPACRCQISGCIGQVKITNGFDVSLLNAQVPAGRASDAAAQGTTTRRIGRIETMSGIKPELASCHPAFVNGYVIEGHAPADDITGLLTEKTDARGLTVPGMPAGSPGMASPTPEHYQVLRIDKTGKTTVFATH